MPAGITPRQGARSRAVLVIGSEVSLWQPLLLDWLLWMRGALPDIALRVHVDVPQDLINQVAGGLVDVAVMYAPPHRPGLKIDLLLEEELVLVTTDPAARAPRQYGLRLCGVGAGIRAASRDELSRYRAEPFHKPGPARTRLCTCSRRCRLLQETRRTTALGIWATLRHAWNARVLLPGLRGAFSGY